jgi:predicted phage terminase large subunit-like protein
MDKKLLSKLSPEELADLSKMLEEYETAKSLEAAHDGFLPFVKHLWPKFIEGEHHRIMAEKFEAIERGEKRFVIINVPPRHGKALEINTPIPTPDGWKKIIDLRVGDRVFSSDGSVCNVVAKSGVWKNRPAYKVVSDDGHSVVADANHEWVVRLCRKHKKLKTYDTEFLANRSSPRRPMLPIHGSIETRQANLLIDPYVLGYWLGDGCSHHATITCSDEDSSFVREEFHSRGYETSDRKTRFTFGVAGILTKLKSLNLLGNKHIPESYMRASHSQRLDLVRGLVDSDGYVSPAGQVEFCSTNEEIAHSFRELVNSLGVKASIVIGKATLNGRYVSDKWRVMFYMHDCALLPRKRDKCIAPSRRDRYLSFEKVAPRATVCIEVDSPDHTFLCGKGFLPTHNSELASKYFPAWFMGRNPDKKIIMSSHTAGLAVDFGRAVKNIVAMPQYRDVFEDVALKADSKAAGRWGTNHGGEYYAIGTGGAIAGRGAHLYVIDDPHSEQDAINAAHNPDVWNKVWDWYTGGPVQRLQPGGAICLVMCVRKGEKVLCADGTWAAIEKLALGQEIITYKDGASAVGKITNKTSSGTTNIFRVKSTSCQLDVSDRHPFLVIEKTGKKKSEWAVKWVRAKELKPGDHVVTIKDVNYGSDTSRSHTKSSFKSKSPLSKQEVWLLGYLWGDGWIMSNRGRKTGIRVACSDKPCLDKIVLDALNEWSGRLPECASRVRTGAKIKASKSALVNPDGKKNSEDSNENDVGNSRVKRRPHPYIELCSVELATWLSDEMGFCAGAKDKRIPEWVFRLPSRLKRSFLRGFMAADGWLRPSKKAETWTTCLSNKPLLEDLVLLARTCGVRPTNIYTYRGKNHPPGSPTPIEFIQYTARFGFTDKYVEKKHLYSQMGSMGRSFRIETVKEVGYTGEVEEVFDIEVSNGASFVANGFVVHNTRWSKLDLTGMILADAEKKGRLGEWDVIELPAQFDSGKYLWEDFWSAEDYQRIKDSIPKGKWLAQYQQNPTSEEGAIIKREQWRRWERPDPPDCDFVIISWDTAFDKTARSDYSACTVWGVFYPNENRDGPPHVMLLDAYKDKLEFPELKKRAYNHYMEVKPDSIIIEKKAAGSPLIYELRSMGIPVTEYTPSRGNDKVVRANAVSDLFASGVVWAPNTAWADEVIEECAEFPNGAHDDYVDSTTQALIRLRHGGLVTIDSDDRSHEEYRPYKAAYYQVGK